MIGPFGSRVPWARISLQVESSPLSLLHEGGIGKHAEPTPLTNPFLNPTFHPFIFPPVIHIPLSIYLSIPVFAAHSCVPGSAQCLLPPYL